MANENPDPKLSDAFDNALSSWTEGLPGIDLTTIIVSLSIGRLTALFNRGLEELVRPYGFGCGELEVLFYLLSAKKPYEMRPSDLTKGCLVTSGAITGRVDRLMKLGFVTRIPSLIDRREMVVKLTRNGEKITRRLRSIAATDSALAIALKTIPAETRSTLGTALRALVSCIEEQIDNRNEGVQSIIVAKGRRRVTR